MQPEGGSTHVPLGLVCLSVAHVDGGAWGLGSKLPVVLSRFEGRGEESLSAARGGANEGACVYFVARSLQLSWMLEARFSVWSWETGRRRPGAAASTYYLGP